MCNKTARYHVENALNTASALYKYLTGFAVYLHRRDTITKKYIYNNNNFHYNAASNQSTLTVAYTIPLQSLRSPFRTLGRSLASRTGADGGYLCTQRRPLTAWTCVCSVTRHKPSRTSFTTAVRLFQITNQSFRP